MPSIDPVVEAYKKGIDRTLIRENLKRSVTERFEQAMALQRLAEELRKAGREARRQTSSRAENHLDRLQSFAAAALGGNRT